MNDRMPPGFGKRKDQTNQQHGMTPGKLCAGMPDAEQDRQQPSQCRDDKNLLHPGNQIGKAYLHSSLPALLLSFPLHQTFDFREFLGADAAIRDQMHQQRLRGAVKNAVDKFLDHAPLSLALGFHRTIDVSPLAARLLQMAFALEDSHHCQHRGVSNITLLQKIFVGFPDGSLAAQPDYFKDFEFLIGRNGACRFQELLTNNLVISDADVKKNV
jgi:hypothetical protein